MTTRTLLKKWPLVVVLFASACLDFQTVSRGVVEHVPTAAAYGGSAPWLIDADVTLDTGTLVPPRRCPKASNSWRSAQVALGQSSRSSGCRGSK